MYEGTLGKSPTPPPGLRHYHGDALRGLFVVAALLMLLGHTLGGAWTLATGDTIIFAVLLMVAAGITNPAQLWINWANVALAVVGALTFGIASLDHYRAGGALLDLSYLVIEALAIIFLFAVYFSVKTVRGLLLRTTLS